MITGKEELEQVCIEENNKCFNQANNTPIMKEPLYSISGKYVDNEADEEILNVTFQCPDNTNIYVQKLIRELYIPERIREDMIPIKDITIKEHIETWKKQKEKNHQKNQDYTSDITKLLSNPKH